MDALDVLMVHRLLARYGHVVDARQWERFDELFTEDVRLDYTGVNVPEVLLGRDAVREFFETAVHPSAHHVSNIDVWEDGSQVRVKSKFFAPYTRSAPTRWYGGDYDDVVVSTPAGWRFASRACTARWQLTDPGGPAEAHRRTW